MKAIQLFFDFFKPERPVPIEIPTVKDAMNERDKIKLIVNRVRANMLATSCADAALDILEDDIKTLVKYIKSKEKARYGCSKNKKK